MVAAAKILVTDAETPTALAVARSLGRAGHRVVVLASSRNAAAAASRFTASAVPVPDPLRDADGWTRALLGTVRRAGFDVLLPVADTALLLADRVRDELPDRLVTGLPEVGALEGLLDKRNVLDRASEAGVPVLTRRDEDGVDAATLPAVVKPGRSRALVHGWVRSATAEVVADRRSMLHAVDRLRRSGLGAYVEPWVPGTGTGVFLLRHGGRVLARFAHRRIREASPLGGPSAVAESVPIDRDLLRHAEALADALDVEGPFMAEFRGRPGGHVLLEVNARYWGTLGLAIAAGVDFPALHVAALLGEPVEPPASYRLGVRRRNLAFDLRRTLHVLRGRPDGLDIPWPGPHRAILDLLGRVPGLVGSRDDPAPARAHALGLIGKAVRHG